LQCRAAQIFEGRSVNGLGRCGFHRQTGVILKAEVYEMDSITSPFCVAFSFDSITEVAQRTLVMRFR
jgi:hypothetical protein